MVVQGPLTAPESLVRSMAYWRAPADTPSRCLVFPEPVLPVILDLSGPGWFLDDGHGKRGPQVSALGVGLHERSGFLNTPARPSCVLLQLDPLGARRLFGIPLNQLNGRTFDLVDVLGEPAHELLERVNAHTSPLDALRLVDDFIARRLSHTPEAPPAVAWAWRRILQSDGSAPISDLIRQVGWSRKHLRNRFLEHVGASPKAAAQLVKFSASMRRLRGAGSAASLACVACESGYSDQAHMSRCFRRHAGLTPTEYRKLLGS